MSASSNLSSDENNQPRQRSLARRANGVVTALLVAFFLGAHGLLGSASAIVALDSSLSWIAWIATAAIAVHVCLNVRVTIEKLSDPEKPPSAVADGRVYNIPVGATRWGQRGSVETWFAMMWLGITAYPEYYGEIDLREEVAAFYGTVLGIDVDDALYEQMLSGQGMRKQATGKSGS